MGIHIIPTLKHSQYLFRYCEAFYRKKTTLDPAKTIFLTGLIWIQSSNAVFVGVFLNLQGRYFRWKQIQNKTYVSRIILTVKISSFHKYLPNKHLDISLLTINPTSTPPYAVFTKTPLGEVPNQTNSPTISLYSPTKGKTTISETYY